MAFGKFPALVDADSYGQLTCKCGSEYLHQTNVTVFQRKEDAAVTTVIAQDGNAAQVSEFPSDDTCNPSPRRHGLILEFWCEECGMKPIDKGSYVADYTAVQRLAIFQHKGCTYMEWL